MQTEVSLEKRKKRDKLSCVFGISGLATVVCACVIGWVTVFYEVDISTDIVWISVFVAGSVLFVAGTIFGLIGVLFGWHGARASWDEGDVFYLPQNASFFSRTKKKAKRPRASRVGLFTGIVAIVPFIVAVFVFAVLVIWILIAQPTV